MLTKTFFIDLHGCAKNQVDAEIINGILILNGWERLKSPNSASLIIINSCGFIEEAKKESINSIIELRQECPNSKIILAGCLSERYSDIFSNEMEELDGVFGNGNLSQLMFLVNSLFPNFDNSFKNIKSEYFILKKKPLIKPPQLGISSGERPHFFNFKSSAYIKITEGCNNKCSFCAIPLIRGALRSRRIIEIITEIKEFIVRGIYEFNLVGQDLGVFGMENNAFLSPSPLSLLLNEIRKLKGRFIIRLLYIHPDHFPLDILPIMASDERFLPYFDIPFQSGSDKIIKQMNRKGSFNTYLQLVNTIKNAFKNTKYKTAVIRTTFLVGFPSETDDDFSKTLKFLKELKTFWSGVFTYSKEEDTPAFLMKGHVKEKTKKIRKEILEEEQEEITTSLLLRFLGEILLVLVEEIVEEENEKIAIGRAWFQAPDVDGVIIITYKESDMSIDGNKIKEGELVFVKINKVSSFDLEGVALGENK